ncbi:MAG: prepilin-type N-terminal cleavage/methylation domain-containing protein [Planctomycetota bacterium]
MRIPARAFPPVTAQRTAYTLIEVLIVVVVVSTLAAAALPAVSTTLDSMKASALAREIAADMRYAQALALKTGVRHRVSFWAGGQAYEVRRENGSSWDLCTHPVTKKPWQVKLDDKSRYAGLTLKDSQFGSSDYLYYDKFGAPEAGGFVTFTLGATTHTINVAPLSGKITVN